MKKQFFRVKQLADQTFLRADKSEVLNNEELQVADQKIEYLQRALTAIFKRLPQPGQNNDNDKRTKKWTEHHLATAFQEQARKTEPGEHHEYPTELFSHVIQKCGTIEHNLAKDYTEHDKKLEEIVSKPIMDLLEGDFPNILKQKRNLSKYILDKDSASNRYNATKKEALKDDMEEADYKVEQSRDALAMEMFSLLARENDFAGYMLQILKLQRAYHEGALKYLKDVIPDLETHIGASPVKRVYGTPLAEHLRVTRKRIAVPLEICITLLHRHGLDEEGLFRIVGSSSRVKRLKASIDSRCFSYSKLSSEYLDVHVLASALKLYLRELPEPLLTSNLYHEWLQSMQKPESERLDVVKRLIAKLPTENRENLALLIQFLSELSHHPKNKMNPSNIAIVIAPNLLWDSEEAVNMNNCAAANMLVELFIKEVQTLFPEDVAKLVTVPWSDDDGFVKTTIEFNVSSENVSVAESPKPNSRKKKTPAPGPPPNNMSKTDQDYIQNEKNTMSASYPSGSSTLNRPHKPKEVIKCNKVPVGVQTDDRKMSTSLCEDTHKNEIKPASLVNLDNSKTVAHKVITEPATPVQVSKAKPVQPVIAQNACDNENFRTTITQPVSESSTPVQKPVAAPRSIDGVTRSSSIKIELKNPTPDVQLRKPEVPAGKPEVPAAKPEIPARPASLSKRSSVDIDPTSMMRKQCSVYSVANKQQPSYVNVHNRNEKFQPGHDNQIAEKEKFLHHAPKTGDINSNSRSGLPPKAVKIEKSDASKSNEDLGEIGEKINGNQKTSHVRTRSEGNFVEMSESVMQTPPSPRSLNKPTQPPPPPPTVKKEPDSTDL